MKPLIFSSEHLSVYKTTITGSLALTKPSIIVNLSAIPVSVGEDKSTFSLLESRLLRNTSLTGEGATAVVIQTADDDFLTISADTRQIINKSWSYSNPLAVDTAQQDKLATHKSNVLKSKKDTIYGYQLFFCFLSAHSFSSIHRIHDMYEVHTQILGRGMMEKYKEETPASVFETTYMSPGNTHYPFYDENRKYPWHSYGATTDSVWMAIVRYETNPSE